MGAHAVITHARNQGATPARLVMVDTGAGALVEMGSWEVADLRAQGLDVKIVDVVDTPAPVSLAKVGDPVPAPRVPVSGLASVDVGESMWWGVPAWVVRGWIAGHLAGGRYAKASWLSGRLHSA